MCRGADNNCALARPGALQCSPCPSGHAIWPCIALTARNPQSRRANARWRCRCRRCCCRDSLNTYQHTALCRVSSAVPRELRRLRLIKRLFSTPPTDRPTAWLRCDGSYSDLHPSVCFIIAKFHYTDTDTDFFAAKLRWVRAGPFGSVSV